MHLHKSLVVAKDDPDFSTRYVDALLMVERLHRLLLDLIKDEFERLSIFELNPVQALLLFNIGDNEVTAGELRSRGYYQGSNVSYNLKKLVETGYMHRKKSAADRRSIRVSLTDKGQEIRVILNELFARHVPDLQGSNLAGDNGIEFMAVQLKNLEKFWTDQIRYIY